jgi:amino-acid N-acetyltransferase
MLNYAKKKLLLPRSVEEIKNQIKTFKVAVSNGDVVGSCAIRDFGKGLVELRSLAVLQRFNGKGVGTKLVKSWIRQLKKNEAKRIFALTYRHSFFTRLGFKIVNKEIFPEKIWADCENCPKKDKCDEIAVLLEP